MNNNMLGLVILLVTGFSLGFGTILYSKCTAHRAQRAHRSPLCH